MTTEIATIDEAESKRKQALAKAIGIDKLPPEQRELVVAIATRYELDLLLKHVVLIEGRPYVTRDALLHVAHRSGQLDGIEVTDPELVKLEGQGDFWRAKCSVYRKDMSRPFTYQGRYPAKGGNQRFAPEMAVKVAEVMALRRAFDISAPVFEERWDVEVPAPVEEESISERVSRKRAAVAGAGADIPAEPGSTDAGSVPDAPMPDTDVRCMAFHGAHGRCERDGGHDGPHQGKKDGERWEQA
jgi:hypothetical protein